MEVYSFEELEEDTVEFAKLKSIFDWYSKNGDTEKFYAKYYAEIPLNSGKYFKGLSRNASTLLSTKVADCMLVYYKQLKTSKDIPAYIFKLYCQREKQQVCSIWVVMYCIIFTKSMVLKNHQKASR